MQEFSIAPTQEQRDLRGDARALSDCAGVASVIIQETPTASFDLDQNFLGGFEFLLTSNVSLTAILFDMNNAELPLPACTISWSLVAPVSNTSLNSMVSLDSDSSPSKLIIGDLNTNSVQAGTYSFDIVATTVGGTPSPTKSIDINVCHVLQTFQLIGTPVEDDLLKFSGINTDVALRTDSFGSALDTEMLDIFGSVIDSVSTYCSNTVISEVTWTFHADDATLQGSISFDNNSSPAYL